MSPKCQGWYIERRDGTRYEGRQIDVGYDNISLYSQAEGFINVKKVDIADYSMSEKSLIPEGLEHRQTNHELLAYLEGQ